MSEKPPIEQTEWYQLAKYGLKCDVEYLAERFGYLHHLGELHQLGMMSDEASERSWQEYRWYIQQSVNRWNESLSNLRRAYEAGEPKALRTLDCSYQEFWTDSEPA